MTGFDPPPRSFPRLPDDGRQMIAGNLPGPDPATAHRTALDHTTALVASWRRFKMNVKSANRVSTDKSVGHVRRFLERAVLIDPYTGLERPLSLPELMGLWGPENLDRVLARTRSGWPGLDNTLRVVRTFMLHAERHPLVEGTDLRAVYGCFSSPWS